MEYLDSPFADTLRKLPLWDVPTHVHLAILGEPNICLLTHQIACHTPQRGPNRLQAGKLLELNGFRCQRCQG